MHTKERVCRRMNAAGQKIGGEIGRKAANGLSRAFGYGHLKLCGDPTCPTCKITESSGGTA